MGLINKNYRICTKTVMDTSDPAILFDRMEFNQRDFKIMLK